MRVPIFNPFKKLTFKKLFYVTFVFLFGLFGNYTFGLSIYETLADSDTQMAINRFAPNMVMAVGGEVSMKILCGGEATVDEIYTNRSKTCVPPISSSNVAVNQKGIIPGGLAFFTASIAGGIIQDPPVPTNMALFIDDTFKDNVFGIKPTYAQGFNNLSQPRDTVFASITFDLWKQTRNIALALTGVLLAIGAFGIMFRQKLSPQSVVTIGSVLPHIPLAIAAIVLSYPIVTVCLNLVGPLNDVARNIAGVVSANLLQNVSVLQGAETIARATLSPMFLIGALIGGLAGGLWIPGLAIGFFVFIVAIVLAFILVATVIRFIYESGQVFITWVIITIMLPVIAAFSILPGRQSSLIFIFKKLIANMLVLPIMMLFLLVGLAVVATMFTPVSISVTGSGNLSDYVYFVLSSSYMVPLIKFTLGIVFIWTGLSARKHIENALGVSGSVMSSIMPQPPQRR